MFRTITLLALLSGLLMLPGVFAAELSPSLADLLPTAADDELVPVVIFLDSRLTMEEVYPDARQLPMDERREYVVNALKERFAQMSPRVMERLELAQKNGEAALLRPLWVLNGVRATAQAGVLRELLDYPEVTYLAYDPVRNNTLDNCGVLASEADRVQDELGVDGSGVIVGHKDSGVDWDRTEYEGRIWINTGEDLNGNGNIDGNEVNGVDDDGNGYIDDFRGWNFDDDDNDVSDRQGHGTKTSSVICSNTLNCGNIAMAPGARLMILSGYLTQGATWESSQYAIEQGAQVISASLSFKQSDCTDSGVLDCPNRVAHRWVMEMELAAGIIHANSTGNEGLSNPIPLSTSAPSDCPPPAMTDAHVQQGGVSSIVSVAAFSCNSGSYGTYSGRGPSAWSRADLCVNTRMPFCGSEGTPGHYPAEFEDYPYEGGTLPGLFKPDVTAPTDIACLLRGGACTSLGGTSGATPHVGGALALIYSAFPGITPEQAYLYLVNGAVDAGDVGPDPTWGFGRLNVYNAIFPEQSTHALIWGTVTTQGNPLAGARAAVDGQRPVLTNEFGEYVISVDLGENAEAEIDLSISKYGYVPFETTVTVDAGDNANANAALTASPSASLNLHVFHSSDGPAAGVLVEIPEAGISGETDGNGDVTLDFLAAGSARVLIGENQDYFAFTVTELVLAAGANDLDFEIARSSYTNPTGDPEVLGYFAMDDLDYRGPSYVWTEINPSLGGDGEALGFSGDGCVARNLSFDFDFYGQTYNSIQISPNGYIAFGDGCVSGWDVQPLPATVTPNGICAVFWQDFEPELGGGGSVYFYSDGTRAIVEWYDVRQWTGYPPGRATFQVVLEPRDGEDGAMLCYYADVSGRIEAVVGIENQAGSSGVLYSHQLQLMYGAAPLRAGRAVAFVTEPLGGTETPASLPTAYVLHQNYPNPFNPTTTFSFEAPRADQVKLSLYDLLGREAAVVFDGNAAAGVNRVEFDAAELATGVYFARLQAAGSTVGVKKVMLLR